MSKKHKKRKLIKPRMSRKAALKLLAKKSRTYGEDPPYIILTGKDDRGNEQIELYDTDQCYTIVDAHPTKETYGYLMAVFQHLRIELGVQHYQRYGKPEV